MNCHKSLIHFSTIPSTKPKYGNINNSDSPNLVPLFCDVFCELVCTILDGCQLWLPATAADCHRAADCRPGELTLVANATCLVLLTFTADRRRCSSPPSFCCYWQPLLTAFFPNHNLSLIVFIPIVKINIHIFHDDKNL